MAVPRVVTHEVGEALDSGGVVKTGLDEQPREHRPAPAGLSGPRGRSGQYGCVQWRMPTLDLSQYTGERKKRDMTILEFWETGAEDELRRRALIYEPA